MRQIEGRRATVLDLEQKEAMIRSTERLSEPALEAFDWLMALNQVRPEALSFAAATFARAGQMSISGEAPSVAVVNEYVQALRDTGQYTDLNVREMQSTQRGVTFMLAARAQPGLPPEVPEEVESP